MPTSKSWDYSAAGIAARRATMLGGVGDAVRTAADAEKKALEATSATVKDAAATGAGSAAESSKKRAFEDEVLDLTQAPKDKRRKLEKWVGVNPEVDDKWFVMGAELGAWFKASHGLELDTETNTIYSAEKGTDGLVWKDVLKQKETTTPCI